MTNEKIKQLVFDAADLCMLGGYSQLDQIKEKRAEILQVYYEVLTESARLETEYDYKKHNNYVEIKKRYREKEMSITESEASNYARANAVNEYKILKAEATCLRQALEELRLASMHLQHAHKNTDDF